MPAFWARESRVTSLCGGSASPGWCLSETQKSSAISTATLALGRYTRQILIQNGPPPPSNLLRREDIAENWRSIVVHKCANPSCSATFNRLGDGRLFVVEAADDHRSRRLEYFFLCNSCSRTMTVTAKKGSASIVVPLAPAKAA